MHVHLHVYMHAHVGKLLGDWISASRRMLRRQASEAIVHEAPHKQ